MDEYPTMDCPPPTYEERLGCCPIPPRPMSAWSPSCPTVPMDESRGKKLLEDRRRVTFMVKGDPPKTIDPAGRCVPAERIAPPPGPSAICDSKVCGLKVQPLSAKQRAAIGAGGGGRAGTPPTAKPGSMKHLSCDNLCKQPPPCVPADQITGLVGPVPVPRKKGEKPKKPTGQRSWFGSGDIREDPPDLDMESAVICCPPDLEIDEGDDDDGAFISEKQAGICTCDLFPCPNCPQHDKSKDEPVPDEPGQKKICDDNIKRDATAKPVGLPPHDCRVHRDRPRDRAPGDPESDFEKQMCECPCCLAFRPHPPATLATSDLYRTCNLPKRLKYPAWFQGYNNVKQHPMYRTTSSEIGRYPPNVHTVPVTYFPIDRSATRPYVLAGPWRDKGLRNTGSIWDAYTYYDFW